jgi:hypothetical protein
LTGCVEGAKIAGGEVRMALVYCAGCDKPISGDMDKCPWCGTATTTAITKAPEPFVIKRCCLACGAVVRPAIQGRGSFLVFLVLCFFFIAPGLIYLAWWFASRREVCGKCGSDRIVPTDTPEGKRIAEAANG